MILIYLPYISFYISCLPKVPLWYRNFVGTCVRIPQWMTLQLKRVRRWVAHAYSEVDVLCHPPGQLINFYNGWLMFESWWCWSHAQNCYVVFFEGNWRLCCRIRWFFGEFLQGNWLSLAFCPKCLYPSPSSARHGRHDHGTRSCCCPRSSVVVIDGPKVKVKRAHETPKIASLFLVFEIFIN